MPTRQLLRSTTGRPLILYCSISRNASKTDASGAMLITLGVITSLAFIVLIQSSVRHKQPKGHRLAYGAGHSNSGIVQPHIFIGRCRPNSTDPH
jgi:hypothetical protein